VARARPRRRPLISRRREIQVLFLIALGLCVPALGTLIAIRMTAGLDIADLTPTRKSLDGYVLANWLDLERRPHALQQGSTLFAGARVQALGYVMEFSRLIGSEIK